MKLLYSSLFVVLAFVTCKPKTDSAVNDAF